ncbi:MAG: methyl viologen-reducing hydrogenase [Deltaproteobacteria bacterium]|nr:methyl viologen-reducing hydrogenase [Deltaproteobacteria bacterium]
MQVRVAGECLGGCAGCEMSLLNLGEGLLDLLPRLSFVHLPLLMDHKYYGPLGQGDLDRPQLPAADLGLVSGGVRTAEHLAVLQAMREKCRVLVALGTCATHGGIPALANESPLAALTERVFRTSESTDPAPDPTETVPSLLPRVLALDEKVAVDVYLPGCPPHPGQIAQTLTAALEGNAPNLAGKSVCDTCPTVREGKGSLKKVRRFLQNAVYDPDKPLDQMRCLLEQGLVCLGPVTRAGCAGPGGAAPRCLAARVPCRGCYGPVRQGGNQLLDFLNALASNAVSPRDLVDPSSLLRFSGAHGHLRPRPAKR